MTVQPWQGRGAVDAPLLLLVVTTGAMLVGAGATLGPLPALGSAVAAAGALAVLSRPCLGVYTLAAVVPVVSGLRRGFPLPGFRLSELLVPAVAGLVLWSTRDGRPTRWRAFDWFALAYVLATFGLGAVALLARRQPFTSDAVGTLVGPLQFLLLYRAVVAGVPSREEWRRVLRLVLLASLPMAALAVLQGVGVGPVRSFLAAATGSPAVNTRFGPGGMTRVTGLFPHWQPLAAYLFLVLVVALALLLTPEQRVAGRRLLLVVLLVDGTALVQTVTLAPILGAILAVPLLARASGARLGRSLSWVAAASVAAALMFAPLLSSRLDQQFGAAAGVAPHGIVPQTLAYRITVWTDQYLPAMSGHWLGGYGPVLPDSIAWRYTESVYVSLLVRGGLVLLLVYVGLVAALWAAARTAARDQEPERRALGRALSVALGLLVVLQTLQAYFLQTGMSHVLWVLAGLLTAAPVTTGRGEHPLARVPAPPARLRAVG